MPIYTEYFPTDKPSYTKVKSWYFDDCMTYCSNKIFHDNLTWLEDESESGFAEENYTGSFDFPVENLMVFVISIILSAGRTSDHIIKNYQREIENYLQNYDVNKLASELPEDEKTDFLHDLDMAKKLFK